MTESHEEAKEQNPTGFGRNTTARRKGALRETRAAQSLLCLIGLKAKRRKNQVKLLPLTLCSPDFVYTWNQASWRCSNHVCRAENPFVQPFLGVFLLIIPRFESNQASKIHFYLSGVQWEDGEHPVQVSLKGDASPLVQL